MMDAITKKAAPLAAALLLAAALAAGCAIVKARPSGGTPIRVQIVKGAKTVAVSGASVGETLSITKGADGAVAVNGRPAALPMRLTPAGEFITVDGRPYRGTVDVLDSGPELIMCVNELSMEAYVTGVINNEISSKWPMESVKAQAVAARTFAMNQKAKRLGSLYHVEGTVIGQVYTGAASEDDEGAEAVAATTGEILVHGDGAALTVYHSNAGGATDAAADVWAGDVPYLLSVPSPFDAEAPSYRWEFAIAADTLKAMLGRVGKPVGDPVEITSETLTPAGRVASAIVKDSTGRSTRLTGEELRSIIGYSALKSTLFTVSKEANVFIFRGKGSGHGVGMSQWGAKGMAASGADYRTILKHYYPNTKLVKAY